MKTASIDPEKAKVLIIDDDEGFCYMLENLVAHLGHEHSSVNSLKNGLQEINSEAFDVVFLDVNLPDGNGLDAIQQINMSASHPEVIIMTSKGELSGAEIAIQSGAWDYLPKPATLKEISLPFIRALQFRKEKLNTPVKAALKVEGIIGESPALKERINNIAQASRSDVNVLITGETGTGKELFAEAIHSNSDRGKKNFTIVDCGAMPEDLVESTLFGHEKGAFTGAIANRPGLLLQADGGTLFLDEVGELPLNLQKAFLRALQERKFRPIGAKREIQSDFRLIAATNRDLDEMVAKGLFRSDLLFRLRSFSLSLPPLRQRKEDIWDLVLFHMGRICKRMGNGIKGTSPDFLETLLSYEWPGNVRELFQAIEMAMAVAGEAPTLYPYHLPIQIRLKVSQKILEAKVPANDAPALSSLSEEPLPPLKEFRRHLVEEGEKQYLQRLMNITDGDLKKACTLSGLGRARLYALLKQNDISRPL